MTPQSPAAAQLAELSPPEPPAEIRRPALAHYLWNRGIELREAGAAIGRSHTAVANYCRPFGDARRVEPDPATAKRIELWTRGEVPASSFKGPSGGPAATTGGPAA